MSYDLLSTHMKKLVDLLSITTPRLHKGSDSPEAKGIMIAMSSLMYFLLGNKHVVSPLQFIHNHQLCIDAITVAPSDRKSKQDDNKNRTSLRTDNNLLDDHTDMSNCHVSTAGRSAIDVLKIVDSNCCMWTVIGYTRASVTRSMMQIKSLHAANKQLLQWLKNPLMFGPTRTSMNPKYVQILQPTKSPKMVPEMEQHHTHINPDGLFQGVYYVLMRLLHKFDLDFLQIMSALSAFEVSGHNPYFFVSAALIYLSRSADTVFQHGVEFGWRLLNFTRCLMVKEFAAGLNTLPAELHKRYNANPMKNGMDDISYSMDEFAHLIAYRIINFFYIWKHLAKKPSNKEIDFHYKLVLHYHHIMARKGGGLQGGNTLAVSAKFWLPAWLSEYRSIKCSPKKKKISVDGELDNVSVSNSKTDSDNLYKVGVALGVRVDTEPQLRSLARLVEATLSQVTNQAVTPLITENAICKIACHVSKKIMDVSK